ncbi:MAG: flagellar biosynthesis protein FlhA [Treponema sp.]|jgi:flagellar biosynthesis protein FlhA|nr:flagellar biosynthesis protein FlhA [Treponema sp.]
MADAAKPNTAVSGSGFQFSPERFYDLRIPIAVVIIVMMIVIPLHTVVLDALLVINLMLAFLVLLNVLFINKPTDFTVFPTVLVGVTLFSLALNVSTTRAILTHGAAFDGRMIRAFSTFVVGAGGTAGLVIGFVIFVAIIVVQLLVITKGATRIAEVAARFTLDAMPGKQMSIDSELANGSIDQKEATTRKESLQKEVDFYGSMDGSTKFISGNVKFGIFMIILNIIGGIIIGSTIHGQTVLEAMGTFTTLTIGDGLLAQLPSLLISSAVAIVVTRAVSTGKLDQQVTQQFSQYPRIFGIMAAALFGFSMLPGFPWYVLLPMAALSALYAFQLNRAKKKEASFNEMMAQTAEGAKKQKDETADIPQMEPPDQLSLELGFGLIPLVDKDKGAELLERMQGMRRQIALDMGIVIPKIRIIDNMLLGSSEYCFKIRGVDVGKSTIRIGYYLCINPGSAKEELTGEKTKDPAFGLPAIWITEDKRDEAERSGYTVVDPPSIIATHLTEIIKRHASELLGRQETQSIIDGIRRDYPAVVDEVLMGRDGKGLTMGNIQKVLQGLLKEQVSIRNMVSILEAIADFAPLTSDTRFLIEKARQSLSSQICHQYANEERILNVLTLDPSLEQRIVDSKAQDSSGDIFAALEPNLHNAWIRSVGKAVRAVHDQGFFPVILCSFQARYLVKTALERELPEVAVLSISEIAQDYSVGSIGVIRLEEQGDLAA